MFLNGSEGKTELIDSLEHTSFTFVFVDLQTETRYLQVLKEEFKIESFPAVFKDGNHFNLAELTSLIP